MIKGLIKGRTTFGFRMALRRVRDELRIQRLHLASLKRARRYSGQKGLKLNLGCGPNPKAGWVNIDLVDTADLTLDLREDLPFDDCSVSVIYSEHFFEHLEYPTEVENLLSEALRVLEPGGLFSVGVPDAEGPVLAYAEEVGAASDEQRRAYAEGRRRSSLEPHNLWVPRYVFTTALHMVNWPFRQGTEHKYAYDFETLERTLSDAGFVSVRRRPFDAAVDTENRREGTLYVDARKPQGK